MSANMLLLKYSYEYEHMILCKDVCFDNIPLSAWKDTLDAADPKYLPQIAERLGVPSFRSTIGDKSPMFEQLLHYLDERAKVNDAKECSSLLFASGLAQLIKNRYPSSLALPVEISPKQCKPMGQLVPFTPKALTLVFDYIIERIADRRPGRQRFYIIKPVFEHDKPEMSFFRNQVLYTCDSARINKLAYVSAYRDVEVVNMLMDYIQHEVIDKRGTLTSLLMSDDEAVSFLSSLRNEVVEMHDLTR